MKHIKDVKMVMKRPHIQYT